jgi:ribose transport system ATP-binding protein
MSMTTPTVMKMEDITRTFGHVSAVRSISLEIKKGEVIGLVGENGAGKSTMLKILSGVEQPDSGTMEINGKQVSFRSPNDATRAGVGVVHQEQSLFTNLTVAENLDQRNAGRVGWKNWKRVNSECVEALKKIGVNIDPTARVGDLSFIDRQMVEIARAVSIDPSVTGTPLIILDEPTAVLEQAETAVLEREIRKLKDIASVIFVSHRLDEIMRICDRVVVMRSGKIVSDKKTSEVTKEQLFRDMAGGVSQHAHAARKRAKADAKPSVEVTGLTRSGEYKDISFAARPGEVVAFLGTNASGREAVVRSIFGAEPYDSGEIKVRGKPVSRWSIVKAVKAGLAYLPAERKVEGMIAGMSATRNIALVHQGDAASGRFLNLRKMAAVAQAWFDRLDVRPNTIERPLINFSGGNQQKIVLAKWLNSPNTQVLLLDHPLRGLDVGAAQTVNEEIVKTCESGAAVILIPDTIEEALEMADEIIVMRDGAISARHDMRTKNDLSLQDIVADMV